MLLMAAIAEIKYFFVEIIILLFLVYLFSRRKIKSAIVAVLIATVALLSYGLLIRLFPEFSNLVNAIQNGGINKLIRLQQHYSSDVDMGRAVVLSYTNKYYLTTPILRLFGIGIGMGTSSSYVDNSFWRMNNISHYDQFSVSSLYIDQGIIGLALYLSFYVVLLIMGFITFAKRDNRRYSIFLIMSIAGSLLVFVYNNVLFSQFCFINYWFLAVLTKKAIQDNFKVNC